MKCPSCGSNDYIEIDDYNICQHCGSKTKLKKDNFSKSLLFLMLVSIAMFIFYPKEELKEPKQTIQIQVAENKPYKTVQKNSKSSISINNTNSNIGIQTITLGNNPIDLSVDNTNANIEIQNIEKMKSKDYLKIHKTINKMHQMDKVLKLKDKDYSNRYDAKLLSFSQVTTDKNGKVLKELSHVYEKKEENKSHVKVTSKNNIYKIENKNKKFKNQKTFYSQEGKRKFFSVETKY